MFDALDSTSRLVRKSLLYVENPSSRTFIRENCCCITFRDAVGYEETSFYPFSESNLNTSDNARTLYRWRYVVAVGMRLIRRRNVLDIPFQKWTNH